MDEQVRIGPETLDRALNLLAELLELENTTLLQIVVCGGSALIGAGLINRTTRDIDVLAFLSPEGTLIAANPFPEDLFRARDRVTQDLGLEDKWLNPGPADLLTHGLPEGITQRLIKKEYGSALTVFFVSRYDQIHFKVFAAADTGPGRHVDDLLILEPTDDELISGARWALSQDPSDDFRIVLKDMMRKLGYEKVAEAV